MVTILTEERQLDVQVTTTHYELVFIDAISLYKYISNDLRTLLSEPFITFLRTNFKVGETTHEELLVRMRLNKVGIETEVEHIGMSELDTVNLEECCSDKVCWEIHDSILLGILDICCQAVTFLISLIQLLLESAVVITKTLEVNHA